MKRWSHPPGLNRRPADYEAMPVKSHLWIFFAFCNAPKRVRETCETDGHGLERMRRDLVLTTLLTNPFRHKLHPSDQARQRRPQLSLNRMM